jgi:hypothetical protein
MVCGVIFSSLMLCQHVQCEIYFSVILSLQLCLVYALMN